MRATNTLIELEPIVDDITSMIRSIMLILDDMVIPVTDNKQLSQTIKPLNDLKGIFTLLNMPGSLLLINESNSVIEQLFTEKSKKKATSKLSVISDAFATLSRYIEYISQKTTSSPDLLIASINALRQISRLPKLKESIFFVLPENLLEASEKNEHKVDSDFGDSLLEVDTKSIRHLRKMYQIGLIEVIGRSNVSGGYRMMKRSIMRANEQYSGYGLNDLWAIALTMIEGYLTGGLLINFERIKVLSLLDLQYRQIEISLKSADERAFEPNVLGEMLYLVGLSLANDPLTTKLKNKYKLFNNRVDDINFQHQSSVLSNPTSKDIQSLNEEILQELAQLEALFRIPVDDAVSANANLLDLVEKLSRLFVVVQLENESQKLSIIKPILESAIKKVVKINEADLIIILEIINQLKELFEDRSYSLPTKIGRKDLSDELQAACHLSQQHIKDAINQFDRYVKVADENANLSNVIKLLINSIQGMQALKLKPLILVCNDCVDFLELLATIENPFKDYQNTMQFFADAIGSIDFYLDTISKNRTPSPRIIEFANDSLGELRIMLSKPQEKALS